jgi:hypothetical protein
MKEDILKEAHHTPYIIHPGALKMYKDLKQRLIGGIDGKFIGQLCVLGEGWA